VRVGDLVRHRANRLRNHIGFVVEQQRDASGGLGMYWRVLFRGEMIYVREVDMEVLSAV
tara:strand:- start:686 stop:862 length:177 start_codon:yes stop_codon:yes gene_type:complete